MKQKPEETHPNTHLDLRHLDKKALRKTLKALLKPSHCENCGSLLPELSFSMDGKQFLFVCYEIAETEKDVWNEKDEHHHYPRKVLASTDYAKLAKYLSRRRGNKP